MKTKAILFSVLLFGSSTCLFSQAGYSSGSVSMNRSQGGNSSYSYGKVYLGFTSDQVIVEEYMNYHRHNILLPTNGADICMDMRWANDFINADSTAILQIGLSTSRLIDYTNIPPLNVCLVIDRSGSMSGDRIEKVKKGALKFVEGLRPDDIISIVTYDDVADVAMAPAKAGDLSAVKNIIAGITTDGSTNLNGGMMLGYQQVAKNYGSNSTNRVILLTDGLANTGETNEATIISNSGSFNLLGIDISTIGVGNSVNFDLLHKIAKNGKGQNHFVGDVQEDIDKVFVDELESLLSPVAKNVSLDLQLPDGIVVESIMGYSPQLSKNNIHFELDNMNSGLTQVILIKFKWKEQQAAGNSLPFNASLNYFSCAEKKTTAMDQCINLRAERQSYSQEYFTDLEVKKNYWIGYMALQLKETARLVENDKEKEAKDLVTLTLKETVLEFPGTTDVDILRIKSIVEDNWVKFN